MHIVDTLQRSNLMLSYKYDAMVGDYYTCVHITYTHTKYHVNRHYLSSSLLSSSPGLSLSLSASSQFLPLPLPPLSISLSSSSSPSPSPSPPPSPSPSPPLSPPLPPPTPPPPPSPSLSPPLPTLFLSCSHNTLHHHLSTHMYIAKNFLWLYIDHRHYHHYFLGSIHNDTWVGI